MLQQNQLFNLSHFDAFLKKFYGNLIGKKALTKAIDRAEKLAASLTERYWSVKL